MAAGPGEEPIRLTAAGLAALAAEVFGRPVLRITAPGGRGRASLRVVFDGLSVIATIRQDPLRRRREADLLRRLSGLGAPVPALLAERGGVLFQSDAGSRRLSAELARLAGPAQDAAAQRAIAALAVIRRAAADSGLTAELPSIGRSGAWLGDFAQGPLALSRHLGIAPPPILPEALAAAVAAPARAFVKWDARPGNAAVQPDGSVLWFDWEDAGLRGGAEDLGFLMADEFWPLDAARALPLAGAEGAAEERFLARFVALQIVRRLEIIHGRLRLAGWDDPAGALRNDRIGADPAAILRLCRHGTGWAALDPLTAPLADWFGAVAAADGAGGLRHWPAAG